MKLNLKNITELLNAPAVEPYVIEKVNKKTGKTEQFHIIPNYSGATGYTTYPLNM